MSAERSCQPAHLWGEWKGGVRNAGTSPCLVAFWIWVARVVRALDFYFCITVLVKATVHLWGRELHPRVLDTGLPQAMDSQLGWAKEVACEWGHAGVWPVEREERQL